MTAPSYRASGTLQAVTTGAVGGVLPGSMTEGEIVVFQVGIFGGGADEDVNPVWAAGNDEVGNPWLPLIPGSGIKKRTDVGSDYAGAFFTKLYVSADWVNPSLSVDDSDTQAKYGVLHVYNNPDPTSGDWFEGETWNNGGGAGTRTGPTVTTTGANRLVCNAFCFVDDDAVALDGTDPGYTIDNQQGSTVSFDARNLIASITKAAAGAQTGAVITDPGTGSDHWVAGGWAFFGGADEAAGTQTLTVPLLTDGDTFFAPTVTVGAVTLSPSLYTDGDVFFTPTVSQGGVSSGGGGNANAAEQLSISLSIGLGD